MTTTRTNSILALLTAALLALGAAACPGGAIGPGDGDGDGDGDGPGGPDGGVPQVCETAPRAYVGLGGFDLAGDRAAIAPGSDRLRLKPTTALAGEYRRVVGSPVNVNAYAATLGRPPARWADEPTPSADTLYALYTLAYQGCLDLTAAPADFAAAPTAASADPVCAAWATRFWDRAPSAAEVAACVDVATTGTATETDPRRRWAHTCASVLTSAGFLAY